MHKLSHIFFTPLYFNNFTFAFSCVRATYAGNFPVLPPLRFPPLYQSAFTAPLFAREKSAFSPFSFFSVARSFIFEKIFGKAARRSGNAFAFRIGRTACIARCTARHFQKKFPLFWRAARGRSLLRFHCTFKADFCCSVLQKVAGKGGRLANFAALFPKLRFAVRRQKALQTERQN